MAFVKGKSGNPSGRPKENPEVKALARSHSKQAINKLAEWMKSDNPTASVAACNSILDRAWGRPAQAVTGEGGEGPVQHVVTWQSNAS